MPVKLVHRIEYGREMLLIGLRQTHTLTDLPTAVPKQWATFKTTLKAARESRVTYGVVCSANHTDMEYMCGVEVVAEAFAQSSGGKLIVPAQKYAVFVHEGHISGIGAAWHEILHHRLPSLNLQGAHAPSFERYDERYEAMSGKGEVEIWCPVQ